MGCLMFRAGTVQDPKNERMASKHDERGATKECTKTVRRVKLFNCYEPLLVEVNFFLEYIILIVFERKRCQ